MRGTISAIAALSLSACASIPTSGTPSNLVDTTWMRVDDENASPHYPTLTFSADGASGFLPGWKAWSARVETRGAAISFSHVRPARLTCSAESATGVSARSFLRMLAAARSSRLSEGDELTVLGASGEEIARFARD